MAGSNVSASANNAGALPVSAARSSKARAAPISPWSTSRLARDIRRDRSASDVGVVGRATTIGLSAAGAIGLALALAGDVVGLSIGSVGASVDAKVGVEAG